MEGWSLPPPADTLWENFNVRGAAIEPRKEVFTVAGLFADIGRLEPGFHRAEWHVEGLDG